MSVQMNVNVEAYRQKVFATDEAIRRCNHAIYNLREAQRLMRNVPTTGLHNPSEFDLDRIGQIYSKLADADRTIQGIMLIYRSRL